MTIIPQQSSRFSLKNLIKFVLAAIIGRIFIGGKTVMKKQILYIFLIFFQFSGAQIIPEQITVEDGLSQGFIPSISQDKDGFLWFATRNGLNRYDGYHFKVFRNDPFDSLSLNSNEINHVQAAGDFLFVTAVSDKPMLFHRKTQRFYGIDKMFPGDRGLLAGVVTVTDTSLCAWYHDGDFSRFYLLAWPQSLDKILISKTGIQTIGRYLHLENFDAPAGTWCFNLSSDKKHLWILTRSSLHVRELSTGSTRRIPFIPEANLPASENITFAYILPGNQGLIRAFINNMLFVYDGTSWKSTELPISPMAVIAMDPLENRLWMSTRDQVFGFDLLQHHTGFIQEFRLDIGQPVKSGFVDNSGLLWIGTDAHGIRKFNPKTGMFKNYLPGYSVYCQPVFNGKRHVFLSDLRKTNWFIKILDIRSGESENLKDKNIPMPYDNHLCVAENGVFWWLGLDDRKMESKLVRYDPESKTSWLFTFRYTPSPVFPELKYQAPGVIWIVATRELIRFNTADQTFTYIKTTGAALSRIVALESGRDGVLWVGTVDGLIKAKPESDNSFSFTKIEAAEQNRNSLPTNSIKSLLIDPADQGVLWIGTNGKGLTRFEISKNKYTLYTVASGVIPDDVVYGILADDEKPRNLWISTNRGLTRFSPETGFSRHFTRNDGLQDNEFNTYASFKSPDGRLFFGGVNGLTVFDPKQLTRLSDIPKIEFTNLSVNGIDVGTRDSSLRFTTDISFLPEIDLAHDQNNLSVDFAVFDFTSPDRNQFMYYLEGAEKPWVHKGFDHSAQYLNLSPGSYTFWLKGANSSGIWTTDPLKLKITIRPPWYLAWPAIILYVLLFILAGFLFNQYQLIQRLKTAEAKRLKNLDQFKSRFYTNITHEFRTPLTVILGITRQLIDKSKENIHPLSLIRRNGENLLRLINQILDLTKLESNELKLNYLQGDILAFIKYIAESLHSLANTQNVMLKVESSQGSVVMDYDPERLMQIIHNLLSNAIKFTPSGGKVTISVNIEGEQLLIVVADTGIGIPKDMQPFLFDRFFQVKAHGTLSDEKFMEKAAISGSTGIGLSLTRELVQIMGGSIRVESPGNDGMPGTRFIVTLPVTNRAVHESETRPPDVSRKPEPTEGSRPETDSKILLIEDNPDVMEYIASCLQEKYQLEFAYNGRVGIDLALEHVPDLIISDVMMPEKDGLEVCDYLKNDERTSHIPIILLTAKVTLEDRLAGLRRGADVYLSKPFHEEELLVWIGQLLARQQRMKLRYADLGINPKADLPDSQPEMLELEDGFVSKLKIILEENYTNPDFSVDDITGKMGMSRAQLYRKLNTLTGKTVTAHLNTIRIEKATNLLKTGRFTVSEVAYEVGYNDPKYFGRLFAEANGKTPGEFIRSK